ncbi:MAG: TerC family protein [Sphingomonadales bacterium]|nr:TerC family protein [Sphingomonadales bacterium]
MLPDLANPEIWISLFTLTTLEIVLGIDNIVFISILSKDLPEHQQPLARKLGLLGALFTRILLLMSIAWIISLTTPIFTAYEQVVSWRDVILISGGLFLLVKGTREIHESVEGIEEVGKPSKTKTFMVVIVQIMLLDVIFSLDSVITAVGMVDEISVMIAAITIAMGIMLLAAEPLSKFISEHPTVKMLALSFLLLIGMALVADGLHFHIPRGYIYFSIAFAIGVEVLNLMAAKRRSRKLAKNAMLSD